MGHHIYPSEKKTLAGSGHHCLDWKENGTRRAKFWGKKWQTVLCKVEQQQSSAGFPQKTLVQLQDNVFWLMKQQVGQPEPDGCTPMLP